MGTKFVVAGESFDAVVYPAPHGMYRTNAKGEYVYSVSKRGFESAVTDALETGESLSHHGRVVVDTFDEAFFAAGMRASVKANAHVGGNIPWAVLEANQRLARETYVESARQREAAANREREAEAAEGRDELLAWLDSLA